MAHKRQKRRYILGQGWSIAVKDEQCEPIIKTMPILETHPFVIFVKEQKQKCFIPYHYTDLMIF